MTDRLTLGIGLPWKKNMNNQIKKGIEKNPGGVVWKIRADDGRGEGRTTNRERTRSE